MEKRDVIARVERQFQLKRLKADEEAQARFEFACENKDFDTLVKEERALEFEIGKSKHFGKSIADLEKRLEKNKKCRSETLAKMGLTHNDLLPKYQCGVCKDTGVVGGKRCACFQNAINDELTKNSNIVDKDLSLTSLEPKSEEQRQIVDVLQRFLSKADSSKTTNIIIIGKTGTGKTHLLNCLANDLMKKRFSVLFTSAFNFNNLLLNIHLAPVDEKTSLINNLVATDVLVLDDLGSENIYKNVTEEYFCNILNERMSSGKFTFVSTNLDFTKIQDRYGDRIFSRLVSDSTCKIRLEGDDLRLTKRPKC